MISTTVNGRRVNIPTSWAEVTFLQFCFLLGANAIKALSVFLEIDEEELKTMKIKGLEAVIGALSFVNSMPVIPLFPENIGPYKISKDATLETLEQYECFNIEFKKIANATEMDKVRANAIYCAIYLKIDGEDFDYEKALLRAKEIEKYSCVEVLAAGTFFLNKFQRISYGSATNFRPLSTVMTSFTRDLKTWLILSVYRLRYSIYARRYTNRIRKESLKRGLSADSITPLK